MGNKRKTPQSQPVFVPRIQGIDEAVQLHNSRLVFKHDNEGGYLVTETASLGGTAGDTMFTLRSDQTPTKSDMRDLIEHKRLSPFDRYI